MTKKTNAKTVGLVVEGRSGPLLKEALAEWPHWSGQNTLMHLGIMLHIEAAREGEMVHLLRKFNIQFYRYPRHKKHPRRTSKRGGNGN